MIFGRNWLFLCGGGFVGVSGVGVDLVIVTFGVDLLLEDIYIVVNINSCGCILVPLLYNKLSKEVNRF